MLMKNQQLFEERYEELNEEIMGLTVKEFISRLGLPAEGVVEDIIENYITARMEEWEEFNSINN